MSKSNTKRGSIKVLNWSRTVPVFPVRYALGDDNSRTPPIGGSFEISQAPTAPGTHYTLRRPRRGYIYVFNERSQFWNIFKVNDWGQLSPVDRDDGDRRNIGYTDNGLLLVPHDSRLWICFTNHRLSHQSLSDASRIPSNRRAFMRLLEPSPWAIPNTPPPMVPHTAALREVADHVADLAPRINPKAFWFSLSSFAKQTKLQLVQSTGALGDERGIVLALDDPTGIAMDFRAMMAARLNKFLIEPERARKNACYQAILDIRASVEAFGEKSYIQRQKPDDSWYGLLVKARATLRDDPRMLDDFNKNVHMAMEKVVFPQPWDQLKCSGLGFKVGNQGRRAA
nr:toxin VasX [uncultured Holophaga sp.]